MVITQREWSMCAFFIHLFMWIMVQGLEAVGKQYPAGYIGCYSDDKGTVLFPDRVLSEKLDDSDLNCATRCKRECKKLGYRYAGTESGEECFCGKTFNYDPEKLSDADCNIKCPGKEDENCGGNWRISIYDTQENNSTIQILTTSGTTTSDITETTTFDITTEISDLLISPTTVAQSTSGTVTPMHSADNMKSGNTKTSFPVVYIFVPVGVITLGVTVAITVIVLKRRKKQILVPEVVYEAADPNEDLYENDTERHQSSENTPQNLTPKGQLDMTQYDHIPRNVSNSAAESDTEYNVLGMKTPNKPESGQFYDHIVEQDKRLNDKTYSHLSYNP
ncbi:uncharacterized protein LOC128556365 isoform X2 [Mercenaria mercenaria]|uniref:uncharacterized protein LOC128556365 isoform X2 n=1 Tax=Mercenaria mercenaria TaxID=6596 RepID=UPI00234F6E8D|nr:uncharacterized protein LOC128556365 isoform X2 [Mercenaria mercenaria]